jgi:hypothetical protein
MSETYYLPADPQPGDCLAFRGKGFLSKLIMLFSPGVSHMETIAFNPETNNFECLSAVKRGVRFKPIVDVVKEFKGDVYYLKVAATIRESLDLDLFNQAVMDLDGVSYDFLHFIGVGIDDWHLNWLMWVPKIPEWLVKTLKSVFHNTPTMKKTVCNGVQEWTFVYHGLGIQNYNPSEETPLDTCRKKLYAVDYKVLKGEDGGIRGYNTKEVLNA